MIGRIANQAFRHRSVPILIVLVAYFWFSSDVFFSQRNITNLMLQASLLGVMALAMAVALVGGQFDLSIGSILALSSFVAVDLADRGPLVALAGATATGALCGVLNGVLVSIARVNAFIATLATMFAIRGVMLSYSGETARSTSDLQFLRLASAKWGPLPVPVLVFGVLAVIAHLVLTRTQVGLTIRSIGGSVDFARLNGVRIVRYQISLFVLTGAGAGFSGALLASRLGAATPTAGTDTALVVIAAVILGGVSLYGGVGTISQAVGGLVVLQTLSTGMDLVGVSPYYKTIIYGCILIAVVTVDALVRPDQFAKIKLARARALGRQLAPARQR